MQLPDGLGNTSLQLVVYVCAITVYCSRSYSEQRCMPLYHTYVCVVFLKLPHLARQPTLLCISASVHACVVSKSQLPTAMQAYVMHRAQSMPTS